MQYSIFTFLFLAASASAWSTSNVFSRKSFLSGVGGVVIGNLVVSPPANGVDLPSGVTYDVVKSGDGPKPDVGELVAIRFAAYAGDTKIDDIFDTPEPYYTRLGSGGLLQGVESTLPLMRVGDRWKMTIPVCS